MRLFVRALRIPRDLLLTGAFVGVALVALETHADVIVPGNLAGIEGMANNNFPFGVPDTRSQQVYSSTEFPSSLLITELRFRPDGEFGFAFTSSLSARIELSTTRMPVDDLSIMFANNVGADNTVVFDGTILISSAFAGPHLGPKEFDIRVPLTTPFFYDPAEGNLLMDFRNFTVQPDYLPVDAVWACDGVSRAVALRADAEKAQGWDSVGVVTQFVGASGAESYRRSSTATTVLPCEKPVGTPEPGTAVLLALGLGTVLFASRSAAGVSHLRRAHPHSQRAPRGF